jgi:FkbM family methyltransferase
MTAVIDRAKAASARFKRLSKEAGFFPAARYVACRKLGIDTIVSLTIGGVPLLLRTCNEDGAFARSCLMDGEFSAAKDLSNVSFIVDAGGYIGTAAIAFAQMFPDARVVTLEPSEENFRLLVRNTAAFANIIPLNAALVGRDRAVTVFDRDGSNSGFSILPIPKEDKLLPMHSCRGISLRSLMMEYKTDRIDILKLDIEGAEIEILETAAEWLPNTRSIFAELHDRFATGCSEAFDIATAGMTVSIHGEKRFARRLADVTFSPRSAT